MGELVKLTATEFSSLVQGKVQRGIFKSKNPWVQLNEKGEKTVKFENIICDEQIVLIGSHELPIIIDGKSKIGNLRLGQEASFSTISITGDSSISGIVIDDDCQLEKIEVLGNSRITDFSIGGKTQIEDVLVSEHSEVSNFIVDASAKFNYIEIRGNAFVRELGLAQSSSGEELHVNGNAKVGQLDVIDRAKLSYLDFDDNASIEAVLLDNRAEIGSLVSQKNVKVGEFDFNGGIILSELSFRDLETNSLIVKNSGTSFPNKMSIRSVKVNILRLIDFHIDSALQISNVELFDQSSLAFLEITRSSFTKLELFENKFSSFHFFVFQNSDLTNSFITQTSIPDVVIGKKSFESILLGTTPLNLFKRGRPDDKQAKSFYEQVKTIYQRQGNRTLALEYQVKELRAYYKMLDWKKNFWDKLTLAFHKYSTNFGTNWIRGFLWLIISTIILYSLVLLSTKGVSLTYPWEMTQKDFNTFFSNYFDFLNPGSNLFIKWDYLKRLEGGELSGFVKLLLLIGKIWTVTFIYQIIQAFRKFGKR